ncbi:ATP-binding protein [Radicibacter daui]|uniref:ATP-binding protein n=1 Tax=Radicibacter daui TaxID=3064829 RepID=UPI0040469218
MPKDAARQLSPWIAGILIWLGLTAAGGFVTFHQINAERMRQAVALDNNIGASAVLLQQYVERSFDTVSLVLGGVADRSSFDNEGDIASLSVRMTGFLNRALDRLPQASGWVIVGADGRIAMPGRPGNGLYVGDRAYFNEIQRDPTSPLFVGSPIHSRISGGRLIPLSLALKDGDDKFIGVIVVNLDAAFTRAQLDQAAVSLEEGLAFLIHDNGQILAVGGDEAGRIDLEQPLRELQEAPPAGTRTSSPGVITETASLAGQPGPWRFDVRHLVGLPLSVVIAAPVAPMMGNMHDIEVRNLVTLGSLSLLLALLLVALIRAQSLQRRALTSALAADKAKSNFLAFMSHEIRTPMTAVLGMNRLMLETPLSDTQRGYADAVMHAGEALLVIVNDILDLSKLEAGELVLAAEDFAPEQLLDEVVSLLGPMARDKGLAMKTELVGRPLPYLKGDIQRLRQILFNYLNNAIKFTRQGSILLRLTVENAGEGLYSFRLEVIDTGPGIAEEMQSRLFQPFVQVHGLSRAAPTGTGLGLAICRQLATLMGGTVGVESVVGVGSRFWFTATLPLGDKPEEVDFSALDLHGAAEPMQVLVVEDVELNQLLLRDSLSRRGHQITVTGNGAEALQVLDRRSFDIALVDIHMPVMDGEQFIRVLRQREGASVHMPAIALTANAMEVQQRGYITAGFDACVTKPIDWSRLLREMHRLAGTGRIAPEEPEMTAEPQAETAAGTPPQDTAPTAAIPEDFTGPALRELVQQLGGQTVRNYLSRLAADGEELVRSYEDKSLPAEERKRAAHSLKGTSANLGITRLADVAAWAETVVETGSEIERDAAISGLRMAFNTYVAQLGQLPPSWPQ